MQLKDLFLQHDNYVTDKWEGYIEFYEEIFSPFREKPIRLLEIGIQNGGSLEIWKKYFTKAKLIVGCDINDKCHELRFSYPVKTVIGDSCSDTTYEKIKTLSKEFDIIIDDASHTADNIICNFIRYFSLLTENGIYIVEDLHCSYWRNFNPIPGKISSIEFFKTIVDIIHYEFCDTSLRDRLKRKLHKFIEITHSEVDIDNYLEFILQNVESITFRNSLCIIKRGRNSLGKRIISGRVAKVDEGVLFIEG
ncbi:class I SAM-dependent methyltransferase [Phorcysia thermohydrogeniphila]|uniref:Cephalosporin hydroxylase n=1 Tax=Phorcysia thermohydrogeniphila TaxID=936138 RepID=A0A4R1GKQ2_9BACT|nr:class I SAM-dependent methyltransferase [Phorcysia thermohydrogeniphila]TCK06639.1 cephalosporin hydroxylase [Phorcysia thermohydrogeniphila]